MPTARWMCLDGTIVEYGDCMVHAFSGAVKYGAGVFEGIRAYWDEAERELNVFRLTEHVERLRFGMKVLRFEPVYDAAFLEDCLLRTLRANALREDTHIRMIAFLSGDDELPATGPVGLVIGAVPRPSAASVAKGIRVRVGSITRIADNALPPRVKATANYINNRAADLEARRDGYDGVIMLTPQGRVSEGAGACFFMVRDGVLITPDVTSGILESITRDTVIRIAQELYGLPVVERAVDRTELYAAQEAFWCGSGQEIVPILEIDRLAVGDGAVGPITRRLQQAYFDLVRGRRPEWPEWRRPVWAGVSEAAVA
ncbi:MAG TPA: branched-chain-amino-acid transaminase [Beijerinckiaceae bacterium]|nr:branched-chain-amino-acid transaminase [Beijerinckiaceae bacterium]